MNPALMQALAQVLALAEGEGQKSLAGSDVFRYGQKHNLPSTAGVTTGYAHGPGGLLTFPGVDPTVYSTMVGAYGGLFAQLPTRPSVYTNPVYEIFTGVYGPSGDTKNEVCDDAPVAGLSKAGKITASFGRIEYQTRVIDITRVGQLNDRADPMDLRLANAPSFIGFPGPSSPQMNTAIFQTEIAKAMFERAVAFQRTLAQMLFTGNPANNSAGGGYKEFTGLERLITTGYRDAESNALLPSVDSYIADFGGLDIATNITAAVNAISDMYRQVLSRARRMNLMPVRWVAAMREELFWELTKVWPCAYYLGGCNVQNADGTSLQINARDSIELRDQMRAGQFLIVDGMRLDVVFEDGIPETQNLDGCFESDIYLIPLSVLGGSSVLFWEYFDFSNTNVMSITNNNLVLAAGVANGMFLETPKQNNACIQFQAVIEPRIILRTPWLAARLENVRYCPTQHTRAAFPDDGYWTNGGETGRSGPSYYPTPAR